jgi:hypothetical protein
LLAGLGFSLRASAAACCGGSFAAPSLIAGDDRAQITSEISQSRITDDVYQNGLWKARGEEESSRTFKIEGASLLSDRWQAGLSLPVIQRERAGETSSGLGDVQTTLGYEYLPEWSYHPLKPKGLGFLQLTLPTGRSIYESENIYGLDSRGRGFWALGAGTLLTKTFSSWDFFFGTEAHRSFDKSVDTSQMKARLRPGWGNTTRLGGGYSWRDFRWGAALAWSYEDPIDVEGNESSSGSVQRFTTASLVANYLIDQEWALSVSYFDQSWFGRPVNTTLSRGFSLQLQKRWQR